ncbi:unnamed protein product [Ectocarpus sp. 12 AP-2014]
MSDDTVNFHAATTHMAAGGARWGGGDATHVCTLCHRDREQRKTKKKGSRGLALETEMFATKKKRGRMPPTTLSAPPASVSISFPRA